MLALFLKIYVLVKGKSGWKTVISTKVLLKMTKDTVQEFVNFQVELSIKENGGTISPKETEFFTLVKMKLWKVDSIKVWSQIANL
tara:strand:- start:1390 stop:1644 length:255 start_codon:yes stop_codon:yes gene_type:complete